MIGTTLGKMGINLCSNGGGNTTQINTICKVSPGPDKCYRRKNKAEEGGDMAGCGGGMLQF